MKEAVDTSGEVVSEGAAKVNQSGVVDLGDAVAETKQAYPVPIVFDSQHQLGYG